MEKKKRLKHIMLSLVLQIFMKCLVHFLLKILGLYHGQGHHRGQRLLTGNVLSSVQGQIRSDRLELYPGPGDDP